MVLDRIDPENKEPSPLYPYLKALAKRTQLPILGTVLGALVDVQDDLASNEDQRKLQEALGGLHDQLGEITDLLRAATIDEQDFSDALRAEAEATYLKGVQRAFRYADFKGIGATPSGVALELDQIFVDLRMSREATAAERHQEESTLRDRIELDAEDIAAEERLGALDLERFRGGKRIARKPIPAGEMLKDSGGFVLLGDPGSGKTTLVKRLARSLALGPEVAKRRFSQLPWALPVVVAISEFDRFREGASLLAFIHRSLEKLGGVLLKTVFERRWEAGEVLVCLDGLDEVASTRDRITCARETDELVLAAGRNRVLVTSRPVGYSICRLAVPAEHFRLEPFSPTDVEAFLKQWHRVYEQELHPEAADLLKAEQDARALFENLSSNDRLASLASNPLMLTLIALIRQQHGRLPERRVELYEVALETLLTSWSQARSLTAQRDEEINPVDPHQARRVWQEVAHWMHSESTGTRHERQLRAELVRILERYDINTLDAEAEATRYLEAAKQSGLLTERGTRLLAFVHQTFQEYLAANHLWLQRPQKEAQDRVLAVAGDPRWHEVVRLCAGFVGVIQRSPDYVTDLVTSLAEVEDPLEPWLCRHLRLALACLADEVDVDPREANEIVVRACERLEKVPYSQVHQAISELFRSMRRFPPRDRAVASLSALCEHESWLVRQEVTRMLARGAPRDMAARTALEVLLQNSDEDVKAHAALGLWRCGQRDEELISSILHHFSSDFSPKPQAVDPELEAAMRDLLGFEDDNLRLRAAKVLGNWGRKTEVTPYLEKMLQSPNEDLRLRAAETLGVWGMKAKAVPHLLALLESESPFVAYAPAILMSWGPQEEAVPQLIRLLESENDDLRYRAASILLSWGWKSEAVPQLLKLLESEKSYLSSGATAMLRNLGNAPDSIAQLLKLLDSENDDLRFCAAKILGSWGRTAEAIPRLVELMESENDELRLSAASELGNLGQKAEAISKLMELMESNTDNSLLVAAITVLESWGHKVEAVPQLINLLDSKYYPLRKFALQTLCDQRADPKALTKVLEGLLSNLDPAVTFLQSDQKFQPDEATANLLIEAIKPRDDDSEAIKSRREIVFDWLWQATNPAE